MFTALKNRPQLSEATTSSDPIADLTAALELLELVPGARERFAERLEYDQIENRAWAVGETFTIERTSNPDVLQLHMREPKSGEQLREDLRELKRSLNSLSKDYAIQIHTPSPVAGHFLKLIKSCFEASFTDKTTALQQDNNFSCLVESDRGRFWQRLSYKAGTMIGLYPKAQSWTRMTVCRKDIPAHDVLTAAQTKVSTISANDLVECAGIGVAAFVVAAATKDFMLTYPAIKSLPAFYGILAATGAGAVYAMVKKISRK